MIFNKTFIKDLFIINHELHQDERGIFRRSFCKEEFSKQGIQFEAVQGNVSKNFKKHTLRGFHYQKEPSNEAKVISCISGAIYNIVLDLRKNSPTRFKWVALEINDQNHSSIFVPAGCANAFLTMSDNTIVHYYMGDLYNEINYSGVRYNDPKFAFEWPCEPKVISNKDLNLPDFIDE